MEYEIAVGKTSERLEAVVRQMIDEGWEPQGGITTFTAVKDRFWSGQNLAEVTFAQAMVRKAKKK